MSFASKYERGQFWMFLSMARTAQNLNVCRISPQAWCCAVRFNVMALKAIFGAALFALSALVNNIRYCLSACIRPFAGSAIPLGVIFSSEFPSPGGRHARHRAILSSSSAAFSDLKRFAALFAFAVDQRLGSFGFEFVRAFTRARSCFSSHMSVRSSKFFATRKASHGYMPASLNFSLETCHG